MRDDVARQRALIAPVLAELELFVQHALRVVLFAQVAHELPAALHLLALHVARALARGEVVPGDALEHRQVGVEMNFLAAGLGAEAEAVDHDERARLLHELGKAGVVDLAADDGDLHAEVRLGVGLAVAQLLERLAQLVDDEIFRAAVAHEVEDVVLVARDARVFLLAELADLGQDAADLVVFGHRLAQRVVRHVHAVDRVQRLEHLAPELVDIVAHGIVRDLEGHVEEGDEKLLIVHEVQQLEVLERAVHLRAGLRRQQGGQEVVAPLDAALEQRLAVVADEVRHVVRRDVQRPRQRRAQTHRKAVAGVEQHLGHVVAGVGQRVLPLGTRLLHERVVRALEQLFKFVKILQVFQTALPSMLKKSHTGRHIIQDIVRYRNRF